MTAGSRRDDLARLGAAAAAVVVTLAAVLTGVTLIRTGSAGNLGDAVPDTAMPSRGEDRSTTLAAGPVPRAHDPLPASVPVMLTVPAIEIATRSLIKLDRTSTGVLKIPGQARSIGWLTETITPGERGVSVLTGHVNFAYERGAFVRLAELRPGHRITVTRADGTTAVFTVYRSQRLPKAVALATATAAGGYPDLRLLTTSGDFDGVTDEPDVRIVVSARLTAVE